MGAARGVRHPSLAGKRLDRRTLAGHRVGPRGPYTLSGEFLEVDPPRRVVQTWSDPDWPGVTSTLSYDLTPAQNGTRITLRHEGGFALPLICANICLGWETSFTRLAELLAAKTAAS